jgi:undecaprenyl diphosphate synthase
MSIIPKHIAIIMDGNARWAKKRMLPVEIGHQYGSKSIQTLVNSAIEYNIPYLTIFAFSTENWDRPKSEVSNLMNLMQSYLEKEADKFIKAGVKILISGNLERLDEKIKSKILKLQDATSDNKEITLNVAFDYGAKREIIDAFKKIICKIDDKDNFLEQISEDLVRKNLYNPEIPDPDLIIRTAGERRLSNFLLWQSAYSEFHFTETLWPDFSKKDLFLAISEFNNRQRNYGKR